jgi:hypothetical protein
MRRFMRAIDFVVGVLGVLGGGGPEPGFWRSVERVLVVVTVLILSCGPCFIVAVKFLT